MTEQPTASDLCAIAIQAAKAARQMGQEPRVALLSHSNFGSSDSDSARKMRRALGLILQRDPELEVEGEMKGDSAVSEAIRERLFPSSRLKGRANLLVMPNLDAANITLNLLRLLGEGLSIGPILLGTNLPAHIVSQSISVRGLINMCAVAAVEAQDKKSREAMPHGRP